MVLSNVNILKIKSIYEVESPYADDVEITKYYCKISEDHEDWTKAKRAVQIKLRNFEEFTNGEFTRSIRGRVTNLAAFDAWVIWKDRYKPLSRKPKFIYEDKEF